MSFYDRYLAGENKQVYSEILSLGVKAFDPMIIQDVERVLEETFLRVLYNLKIIYAELEAEGYIFQKNPTCNSERPLPGPLPNAINLLEELDQTVEPFGYIPLSLKYFYKLVGSVNFGWDYEIDDQFLWKLADPIKIDSVDDVVEILKDEGWKDEMHYYLEEEDFDSAFIDLAPDSLHKDNMSGGLPYAIQITKKPSIDGLFLNEPNNATFIDYLRICINRCGLPGIESPDIDEKYQTYYARVKPQLKPI